MNTIAASAVTRSGGSAQRLPRRPGLGCVSHPVASVSSVGPNPQHRGKGVRPAGRTGHRAVLLQWIPPWAVISCRREYSVPGEEGIQGRAATVHLFTCLSVHLFTCSPVPPHRCWTSVVAGVDPHSYTPLAGIPGVGFSARGRATRVSSHPFSYGKGEFTATPGQPAGASERAAVSDWPQDFGGQGEVAAGADSTPGSLYLSASPAPWPWPVAGPGWPASRRSGRTPSTAGNGVRPAGRNLAQGVPSGRYAVRPRLRARGFSADTGMTGWVFAKRAPPRTYGRWRTIPRTSGLTRLRGGRLGSRVRGFSRPRPRRHRRRHRRDHSSLPVVCPQTAPTSP